VVNKPRRPVLSLVGFPLLLCAIVALCLVFRSQLAALLADRDVLRAWILDFGIWGPAVFIALQVVQVVVFVIPGELIQIAGGYVFGLWLGSLYSIVGILAGSVVNFYAGRLLGRPFVESLFDKKKIEEVERLTGSGKGAAGFFLLFLIPGIPKDILCYVAGVSTLRLSLFMGVSMTGRLPGILGSALIGGAAYGKRWILALAVLGAAAALFAIGLIFRERVQGLLARVLHGRGGGDEGRRRGS